MKRSFFKDLASFFALFGIVFIPFPFVLTDWQYSLTDLIFGKLIGFFSANIFGKTLADNSVHSDSSSMYILVLLLLLLALITTAIVQFTRRWKKNRSKIIAFVYTACIYYLALQLLKYGVDKIFKNQFYLPEPNTLYTPLGHLEKDILYWSSMGTSHFYSVFMGIVESVAAIFLFFRKTRILGLLMALAILLNVIAVNFGFDIGVKLYSLFLLFITIYLLAPYASRLYFFITQQTVAATSPVESRKKSFLFLFLKCFVIGLILLETMGPFIRRGNFNGDLARRPHLHGAYEVTGMIKGVDTLINSSFPVKRFFIHKEGYMIFQDQQDHMQDYKFSYNSDGYMLTDYQMQKTVLSLDYNEKDSVMLIKYTKDDQPVQLKAKAIDWRRLPALKKGFRWTSD
jgi:hypothetical protein